MWIVASHWQHPSSQLHEMNPKLIRDHVEPPHLSCHGHCHGHIFSAGTIWCLFRARAAGKAVQLLGPVDLLQAFQVD